MRAGRVVAVLLFLGISACTASDQQMAQCEFEVRRTYPNSALTPSGESVNMLFLCMKAAGYEFNWENPNCAGVPGSSRKPACYVSSKFVALVEKLREWGVIEAPSQIQPLPNSN